MTPQIVTHPHAWKAGYADGLAGKPHGTDPLSQVDELAYASGYVEGKAAEPRRCTICDGRGWLGAATGGMFAYIGRLALSGRLPIRTCAKCNGSGETSDG